MSGRSDSGAGVVAGDTFAGTAEIGGMEKVSYTGVRIKQSK